MSGYASYYGIILLLLLLLLSGDGPAAAIASRAFLCIRNNNGY
jgi:hypothetical protein